MPSAVLAIASSAMAIVADGCCCCVELVVVVAIVGDGRTVVSGGEATANVAKGGGKMMGEGERDTAAAAIAVIALAEEAPMTAAAVGTRDKGRADGSSSRLGDQLRPLKFGPREEPVPRPPSPLPAGGLPARYTYVAGSGLMLRALNELGRNEGERKEGRVAGHGDKVPPAPAPTPPPAPPPTGPPTGLALRGDPVGEPGGLSATGAPASSRVLPSSGDPGGDGERPEKENDIMGEPGGDGEAPGKENDAAGWAAVGDDKKDAPLYPAYPRWPTTPVAAPPPPLPSLEGLVAGMSELNLAAKMAGWIAGSNDGGGDGGAKTRAAAVCAAGPVLGGAAAAAAAAAAATVARVDATGPAPTSVGAVAVRSPNKAPAVSGGGPVADMAGAAGSGGKGAAALMGGGVSPLDVRRRCVGARPAFVLSPAPSGTTMDGMAAVEAVMAAAAASSMGISSSARRLPNGDTMVPIGVHVARLRRGARGGIKPMTGSKAPVAKDKTGTVPPTYCTVEDAPSGQVGTGAGWMSPSRGLTATRPRGAVPCAMATACDVGGGGEGGRPASGSWNRPGAKWGASGEGGAAVAPVGLGPNKASCKSGGRTTTRQSPF